MKFRYKTLFYDDWKQDFVDFKFHLPYQNLHHKTELFKMGTCDILQINNQVSYTC